MAVCLVACKPIIKSNVDRFVLTTRITGTFRVYPNEDFFLCFLSISFFFKFLFTAKFQIIDKNRLSSILSKRFIDLFHVHSHLQYSLEICLSLIHHVVFMSFINHYLFNCIIPHMYTLRNS